MYLSPFSNCTQLKQPACTMSSAWGSVLLWRLHCYDEAAGWDASLFVHQLWPNMELHNPVSITASCHSELGLKGMGSSYLQREPAVTRTWTQLLTVVGSALYHWAIPLSYLCGLRTWYNHCFYMNTITESWSFFSRMAHAVRLHREVGSFIDTQDIDVFNTDQDCQMDSVCWTNVLD